jgi:ribose 5-phosphate isomerase RpiB
VAIIEHLNKKEGIELKDFGANAGEVILYPDVQRRWRRRWPQANSTAVY